MLSRKHYTEIAKILAECYNGAKNVDDSVDFHHDNIVDDLCNYLKKDNLRFDNSRFRHFINAKIKQLEEGDIM